MGPRISTLLIFVLNFLALCCGPWVYGADEFQFEIGTGLHYYSGLSDQSLAPNSSYLVRFGSQLGGGVFRWKTNMSIFSSGGSATFDDTGTSTELTYSLLGGEFNLGFGVYPLGSISKLTIQPYFGGAGSVQVDSIQFPKDATTSTTFPKTDSPTVYGYTLSVGADVQIDKNYGLKIQVEQAIISGKVANAPFALSGNRILLGLYFN